MEVELTDKEFERLVRALLQQRNLPNKIPIDQRLIENQLLEERFASFPKGDGLEYLAITTSGYRRLMEEQLRLVLCLYEVSGGYALQYALARIEDLDQEELPMLLVHEHERIRKKAAEVMQQYNRSEVKYGSSTH